MKRITLPILLLAAALFAPLIESAARQASADEQALKAEVLRITKEAGLPSMQVTYTSPTDTVSFVVVNDEFYSVEGRRQEFSPLSTSTIYQAASISKPPLAYIALKLVEEGKLDLDEPVYRYYPQMLDLFADAPSRRKAKKITARMILVHTTGLDNKTYDNIVYEGTPGGKYIYSGPGIHILDLAIGHILGKDLREYSKDYIFDKLGMEHSNYYWQEEYAQTAAIGYLANGKWRRNENWKEANAAYTLRTTSEEYTRFLLWILDGADLTKESYEMMFHEFFKTPSGDYQGLIWRKDRHPELGTIYHHSGNNRCYKGWMGIFPDTRETLCFFTNYETKKEFINPMIAAFMGNSVPLTARLKREEGSLYSNFVNPPAEARPLVWWHWMNGNITKEGIRKDLAWMDRIGVAGFHLFDAQLSTPQIVERKDYMKPGWNEALQYALTLADSYDMEVAVAASPGWSSTGGPWVKAEDGMKKIVWKEMTVEGGRRFDGELPAPFTTSGKFQNLPITNTNGDPRDLRYYTDVAVLAAKLPSGAVSMEQLGAVVTSSGGGFTLEQLTNGDLADGAPLPEDKDGKAWICVSFPQPQTIRSLTLVSGYERPQWYGTTAYCVDSLQVSDDGVNFRTVMGIPVNPCPQQTISFEPVTATHFRLLHDNDSGTRRISDKVSEFVLYPHLKVNLAEEKALYSSTADMYKYPTAAATSADIVEEVVDLTSMVKDGRLVWDIPEGRWKIYRFGATLTGKRNHPATREATGLEVDKIDPVAWKNYFRAYLDSYKDASGGLLGQNGIQYLMVDSYEARLCNWTPALREEFKSRRGYDPLLWLPAVTGDIVGSSELTEKFLWDFRTTIAELFEENYRNVTSLVQEEYGMKGTYIESHENGRVFGADGMAMKSTSTVPMAAMWMTGNISQGIGDIKESASVANIYGQKIVAAESFTVAGTNNRAWSYYPGNIRPRANRMLAAGLNRFVIHDSAHQPSDDHVPGLSLGVYGQWFNRHETWAEHAGAWTDYLSRNCVLLQAGKAVCDILYYYGEDSNALAHFARREPRIPAGYDYNYVSPGALLDVLKAEGGKLMAPTGIAYRILYLHPGQTDVMSLKMLRRIAEIARSGVIVCGNVPKRPASMTDSCEEFDGIVKDIWYSGRHNVYADKDLAYVVGAAGIEKDLDCNSLKWIHRQTSREDIYWICNPKPEDASVSLSVNVTGRRPSLWDPMTGKIRPVEYQIRGGRTHMDIDLKADEALAIVMSEGSCLESRQLPECRERRLALLDGRWDLSFQKGRGVDKDIRLKTLRSLTDSKDPQVRNFSGTVVYKSEFRIDEVPSCVELDLGKVGDMALVRINGNYVGTVWTSPYRLDVTGHLCRGINEIEIHVTNRWVNRLVGDAALPETDRITYVTHNHYKPDTPLIPSGLMGPVELIEIY